MIHKYFLVYCLILIKIISHKYFKFCLQNLSLHIKLNKILKEDLKYLKLDLDNKNILKKLNKQTFKKLHEDITITHI